MKLLLSLFLFSAATIVSGQHSQYQPHYLVGLLNYPNSNVPDVFRNHTSGAYIDAEGAPFSDVPLIGFSDIETYYDEEGNKVLGQFFCLSDNGYGSSDTSGDYPLNVQHLEIQKPFTYRHGESTFEKYTEAINMGTALLHDPDHHMQWENGADIQVTYNTVDSTWDDYKTLRVLTGRDFDVEGMAVLNQTCAVVGEEFMPALFMVNPMTGVVLSPFVRTPDIDSNGDFNGNFLSTRRDKVHCSLDALAECTSVDSTVVDASGYRKHDPSGGYEGLAVLADGIVAAFLEMNSGDTTLSDEPGVRVYKVKPGNCSSGSVPVFDSFMGYYPLEVNAGSIADVSSIPGSSQYVAVIERNDFPKGHMFPAPLMPANKVCIVDLLDLNENKVMQNKKCILNYHAISDPFDVDNNGIFTYAHTQVTSEALIVVDEYCIVAGTDTNFPWVNQFELAEVDVPDFQQVSDSRFMVICFVEPIFSKTLLEDMMMGSSSQAGTDNLAVGRSAESQTSLRSAGYRNAWWLPAPLSAIVALIFV